MLRNGHIGFGAGGVSKEAVVTGTWDGASATSDRTFGGAGGGQYAGIQFTATGTGWISSFKMKVNATVVNATFTGELWSDDGADSPSAQIGNDASSNVLDSNIEYTYTWSDESAVIVEGTLYWILWDETGTNGDIRIDCVDADAAYKSGRHNTATTISADISEEWRIEITQMI